MDDLFLDPSANTPISDHAETSVDIYDDLSLCGTDHSNSSPLKKCTAFTQPAPLSRGTVSSGSSTPYSSQKKESADLDLYSEHLEHDLAQKEKIFALEKSIAEGLARETVLNNQVTQLKKNISSLYITAQKELQAKDQEIATLKALLEKREAESKRGESKWSETGFKREESRRSEDKIKREESRRKDDRHASSSRSNSSRDRHSERDEKRHTELSSRASSRSDRDRAQPARPDNIGRNRSGREVSESNSRLQEDVTKGRPSTASRSRQRSPSSEHKDGRSHSKSGSKNDERLPSPHPSQDGVLDLRDKLKKREREVERSPVEQEQKRRKTDNLLKSDTATSCQTAASGFCTKPDQPAAQDVKSKTSSSKSRPKSGENQSHVEKTDILISNQNTAICEEKVEASKSDQTRIVPKLLERYPSTSKNAVLAKLRGEQSINSFIKLGRSTASPKKLAKSSDSNKPENCAPSQPSTSSPCKPTAPSQHNVRSTGQSFHSDVAAALSTVSSPAPKPAASFKGMFADCKSKIVIDTSSEVLKTSEAFSEKTFSTGEALPILTPGSGVVASKPPDVKYDGVSSDFVFAVPEISNQESVSTLASNMSVPFTVLKSVDTHIQSTNQTWPFEVGATVREDSKSAGFHHNYCKQENSNNNHVIDEDSVRAFPIVSMDTTKPAITNVDRLWGEGLVIKKETTNMDIRSTHLIQTSISLQHDGTVPFTPEDLKVYQTIKTEGVVYKEEKDDNLNICRGKSEAVSRETESSSSTKSSSDSSECASKDSDKDAVGSKSSVKGSEQSSDSSNSSHGNSNPHADSDKPSSKESDSRSSQESNEKDGEEGKSTGSSMSDSSSDSETPVPHTPQKSKKTAGLSQDIPLTANFIMLGDEENTCTNFVSPSKPVSHPSEFYPPGVRGAIHEGGSHHRHIRGSPALIPPPIQDIIKQHVEETDISPIQTLLSQHSSTRCDSESAADQSKETFVLNDGIESQQTKTWKSAVESVFAEVFEESLSVFKQRISKEVFSRENILATRIRKEALDRLRQEVYEHFEISEPCEYPSAKAQNGAADVDIQRVNLISHTSLGCSNVSSVPSTLSAIRVKHKSPEKAQECNNTPQVKCPSTQSRTTGHLQSVSVGHLQHPHVSDNDGINFNDQSTARQVTGIVPFSGLNQPMPALKTVKERMVRVVAASPDNCVVTSSDVDQQLREGPSLPVFGSGQRAEVLAQPDSTSQECFPLRGRETETSQQLKDVLRSSQLLLSEEDNSGDQVSVQVRTASGPMGSHLSQASDCKMSTVFPQKHIPISEKKVFSPTRPFLKRNLGAERDFRCSSLAKKEIEKVPTKPATKSHIQIENTQPKPQEIAETTSSGCRNSQHTPESMSGNSTSRPLKTQPTSENLSSQPRNSQQKPEDEVETAILSGENVLASREVARPLTQELDTDRCEDDVGIGGHGHHERSYSCSSESSHEDEVEGSRPHSEESDSDADLDNTVVERSPSHENVVESPAKWDDNVLENINEEISLSAISLSEFDTDLCNRNTPVRRKVSSKESDSNTSRLKMFSPAKSPQQKSSPLRCGASLRNLMFRQFSSTGKKSTSHNTSPSKQLSSFKNIPESENKVVACETIHQHQPASLNVHVPSVNMINSSLNTISLRPKSVVQSEIQHDLNSLSKAYEGTSATVVSGHNLPIKREQASKVMTSELRGKPIPQAMSAGSESESEEIVVDDSPSESEVVVDRSASEAEQCAEDCENTGSRFMTYRQLLRNRLVKPIKWSREAGLDEGLQKEADVEKLEHPEEAVSTLSREDLEFMQNVNKVKKRLSMDVEDHNRLTEAKDMCSEVRSGETDQHFGKRDIGSSSTGFQGVVVSEVGIEDFEDRHELYLHKADLECERDGDGGAYRESLVYSEAESRPHYPSVERLAASDSVRTLSSDLYLSESDVESIPSPVKRPKPSGSVSARETDPSTRQDMFIRPSGSSLASPSRKHHKPRVISDREDELFVPEYEEDIEEAMQSDGVEPFESLAQNVEENLEESELIEQPGGVHSHASLSEKMEGEEDNLEEGEITESSEEEKVEEKTTISASKECSKPFRFGQRRQSNDEQHHISPLDRLYGGSNASQASYGSQRIDDVFEDEGSPGNRGRRGPGRGGKQESRPKDLRNTLNKRRQQEGGGSLGSGQSRPGALSRSCSDIGSQGERDNVRRDREETKPRGGESDRPRSEGDSLRDPVRTKSLHNNRDNGHKSRPQKDRNHSGTRPRGSKNNLSGRDDGRSSRERVDIPVLDRDSNIRHGTSSSRSEKRSRQDLSRRRSPDTAMGMARDKQETCDSEGSWQSYKRCDQTQQQTLQDQRMSKRDRPSSRGSGNKERPESRKSNKRERNLWNELRDSKGRGERPPSRNSCSGSRSSKEKERPSSRNSSNKERPHSRNSSCESERPRSRCSSTGHRSNIGSPRHSSEK